MKKLATLAVLAVALVVLPGCTLFKKTQAPTTTTTFETVPMQGAMISVNYVGTLDDGTVFDTNIEQEAKDAGIHSEFGTYQPLTFTIGEGRMIPGFEEGIVGMKKGETKTFTIEPDKAYGYPNNDYIITTGVSMFTDAGIEPKVGEIYDFGGAPGTVTALSGDQVTFDLNSQLAGKTLTFKVTIDNIQPVATQTGSIE